MILPTTINPCPHCGRRVAVFAPAGPSAPCGGFAVQCAKCGTRGPWSGSVDLESIPGLSASFKPGQDIPDEREVARLAWNAISAKAELGDRTAGMILEAGA